MFRTLQRGLSILISCRRQRSNADRGTIVGDAVRSAGKVVTGTAVGSACCMTWVMFTRGAQSIFMWSIPSTAAKCAEATLTPTCPMWQSQVRTILAASSPSPCALSSMMASLIAKPRGTCGATTAFSFPLQPYKTGSRRRGKKGAHRLERDYLPWALSGSGSNGFSGYIAADELYDGPFCILSIVDNRSGPQRSFTRLIHEVLDHSPTHADIERFFKRFKAALEARGLALRGITTDGSPLYPEPIRNVFGDVSHQVCQFHVIAELTKAILKAVARVRKQLKPLDQKLPRGRPATPQAKRAARRNKRLQKRIADLFDNRYLFVQRHLTAAEHETLLRITRGLKHLRTLRAIMDEVYRLFDRRCRMETALKKLGKLRMRIKAFKRVGKTLQKLFSPTLEKALVFLDDSLLPATSNAVERGNRRYRKMQKSVYRVRTHRAIVRRMALDLLRDKQRIDRLHTTCSHHRARAG